MREKLREEKREEERKRDEQARVERKKQEKREHVQQQSQLATFAATEFLKISLSPTVHLCRSLASHSVAVDIAGEGLQQMRDAYKRQDWLGVLALLRTERLPPNGEYPDQWEIESALRDLNGKQFHLILKPQFRIPEGKELHYLIIMDDDSFQIWTGWFPHPDGIGWCHSWMPDHKEVFLFVCKSVSLSTDDVHRIHDGHVEAVNRLTVKKRLGEITDEQYRQECRRLSEKQRAAYVALMSQY